METYIPDDVSTGYVPYVYNVYDQALAYIEWQDAQMALRTLEQGCDHPDNRVVWKLQTYEYVCRACKTVFPYDKVREIVDGG